MFSNLVQNFHIKNDSLNILLTNGRLIFSFLCRPSLFLLQIKTDTCLNCEHEIQSVKTSFNNAGVKLHSLPEMDHYDIILFSFYTSIHLRAFQFDCFYNSLDYLTLIDKLKYVLLRANVALGVSDHENRVGGD